MDNCDIEWFALETNRDLSVVFGLHPGTAFWTLVLTMMAVFPGAQMVKNLPAMQETQVRSLGQEDPLEKGMATYSSILTWRIPWTEEPGGLLSIGLQRVKDDPATNANDD